MAPVEESWVAALARSGSASARSDHERERWGGVKTWVFGQMLASSFAKVSLEHKQPTDWDDACFSRLKPPAASASSSSSTLYADAEAPSDLEELEELEELEDERPSYRQRISSNQSSHDTNTSSNHDDLARHTFDIVRVIGAGSYGTVLLSRLRGSNTAAATAADDKLFAIKVVDKRKLATHGRSIQSDRDTQRVRTEKHVLCALAHPFITKLYCSFETPDALNFVMEYCPGGDLYFLLEKFPKNRLPEPYVVFYAASVALALSYLHERGVVYRDLKPENLLLDRDGFIRLADFGFARAHMSRSEQSCTTFCGSADYIAPEVVRGSGYGMAADLWSFGCVVYELLTGFPPFYSPQNATDRRALFRKIETNEPSFAPHLSPAACDLLTGLLHKDAAARLGANGMQPVFDHPFFATVDWYQLATKQVIPPLVPSLAGPLDTSNFEDQFTTQQVDGYLVYEEYDAQCPRSRRQCSRPYFDDFDWCAAPDEFA